jgi:hypothetical protein
MDKTTLIKVTNRFSGNVGYSVPDLGVRRQFMPRETKEITFEELERLSFTPGGMRILQEYLIIKDKDAVKELLPNVEPEYFYSEDEVKKLMLYGSIDEFLDCLDFAPDGVLDIVKEMAVSLPLDNMSKRNAIQEKLNFNVTRAIEIRDTKYDGDSEETSEETAKRTGRRAAAPKVEGESEAPKRRATPKYEVIE